MAGKIRFAPSPTGFLHEGHLLSALYVWAAARKWGLKVHLRIEDHDKSRARKAYIEGIREDLAWFGFHYDSESIQSNRETVYKNALAKLESQERVYPCYCSRKLLEAENPKSETGEIIYQGKCRYLDERRETRDERNFLDERRDRTALGDLSLSAHGPHGGTRDKSDEPHNLRFVVPNKVIHWHDLRLGDFDENPKMQCGDFPIRDRDNQWTYQFAVCVDDIDEGITHIVRGEDIRSSTARQIALMQTLGRKDSPIYLHHALITDQNGKKLSKRELAYSLRQDREAGKTPEALLGEVCFRAKMQAENNPLSLESAISLIQSKI